MNTQMVNQRPHLILRASFLTVVLLALVVCSSYATVLTLSGGDPSEGYSPLPVAFAAIDLGGTGTNSIQGVTFTPTNARIAVSPSTAQSPAPSGYPTPTTANDTALVNVMFHDVFVNPGPLTLTISGLTVGQTYQLDTFVGFFGSARTYQFSAAGAATVVDTFAYPGSGTTIDAQQQAVANASGQIVLTVSIPSGPNIPSVNAMSVTAAPEPGAAALLALGAAALLGWRRNRFAYVQVYRTLSPN